MNDVRITLAGDAALLVEFANRIDPEVNARVVAVWRALQRAAVPGVRDLVPAYRTLGVYFDPLRTDVDRLGDAIRLAATAAPIATLAVPSVVRVPVCYGGMYGPDLEQVAADTGSSPDDVVAVHAAPVYRVFLIGFSPGFAYMGTVDERIAVPRLATPRIRVPAGSVGIAGRQTGVYPSETPGGWRLIGRTPLKAFDPGRADPFLFKTGDVVQFQRIGTDEYHRFSVRGGT
jgi:inhibitor of KinA